jgi:kynureninase
VPSLTRSDAVALDARDPLAGFRDRFVIDPAAVYLDGNSLGCLPVATEARLRDVVSHEWGVRGIRGWSDGWMELPVSVGDFIGRVALGAWPGQVVVGDSTSVCFYKLASAALDARPRRTEIVTDVDNFPTDRYVLEGLAAARGLSIVWVTGDPVLGPSVDDVRSVVGPRTALVSLSHVSYRSAAVADMAGIGAAVRDAGALMLWDLSHTVGSVPVALDECGADLAVGCTYKYLNGGPGAPAFMYVRRDLLDELRQPIWGWLGREDPFEMARGYAVAAGVRGLLSGSPPVIALSAVDEGVRVVEEAGMAAIRAKGMALTDCLIELADEVLAPVGVHVASPRDASVRGAHVVLAHPESRELTRALIDRGVIVDFRGPDLIRVGLSPLTTRYVDVWDAVEALRSLLVSSDGERERTPATALPSRPQA